MNTEERGYTAWASIFSSDYNRLTAHSFCRQVAEIHLLIPSSLKVRRIQDDFTNTHSCSNCLSKGNVAKATNRTALGLPIHAIRETHLCLTAMEARRTEIHVRTSVLQYMYDHGGGTNNCLHKNSKAYLKTPVWTQMVQSSNKVNPLAWCN